MSVIDTPSSFSFLCHRLSTLNLALPELTAFEENPVVGIRDAFSLGTPLVTIYNLLPLHYPRINIDLEVLNDDDHSRRLAVALFAMNVEQFLGCERFSYDDLQSIGGLHKAVLAVHSILDKCSEVGTIVVKHAHSGQFTMPSIMSHIHLEEKWIDWVKQTISSERQYIKHIGLLEAYSKALIAHDALDEDIINHVFPQKFFTFTRKMCVRMECTSTLPWQEQCWGRLFTDYTEDIGIMYRIYCVNRIVAQERLLAAIQQISSTEIPETLPNMSIAQLLDIPYVHLLEYAKQLEVFIPISASVAHPHHTTLVAARDTIHRKLHGIVIAQEEATTQQKLESLKRRITDWKGLNPTNTSKFGAHLCEDQLLLRKNGVLQTLWIFLFRNLLIYCDEALPLLEPSSLRHGRGRRKLSSATAAPSSAKDDKTEINLDIKGYIHIAQIRDIGTSTIVRTEGSELREYNALTLTSSKGTDLETIALVYRSERHMRKWHRLLESARSTSTPRSVATSIKALARSTSTPMPITTSVKTLAKVHLDDVKSTFMIALSYPVKYDDLMASIEMKMRRLGLLQDQNQRHLVVSRVAGNGSLVRLTSDNDAGQVEWFSPGSVTELYARKW
ncbi:hypothetical protein L218DRAFT_983692 [Marasmius fiardii PR-910]|nr:hypothetical protein L218DRAFT_983692 [Marasmius fiardii PR-910]